MQNLKAGIDSQSIYLLIILSILWGGSFMFVGIAVKELPSLLIVFIRVAIAAAVLLPVHLALRGGLPRDANSWITVGGMSLLNNVIPFSAIVYGQHHITAGLAAVLNATTPLFGAIAMSLAGVEGLTMRKTVGLLLGLLGVTILRGMNATALNAETLGIMAVLLASASYGMSSLWAKRRLGAMPPLTSATCQLLVSTLVMGLLVFIFDNPARLAVVTPKTWFALCGLAVLSTSLAYLIFFRIIARAGPSVVLLVTMIIPLSAMLMGHFALGENFATQEVIGALVIGIALLVIDGRIFSLLSARPT
jgi:drug/metabolite transporter (DMT)-like permease